MNKKIIATLVTNKLLSAYYEQLVAMAVLYISKYYSRETVEVFIHESDKNELMEYARNYLTDVYTNYYNQEELKYNE